jgi:uncharacterized protein
MRWLYLHGFGSGPDSSKGVAFAEHFARRGVALERLDLRVPSFERMRLSAMIDRTRAAIDDQAIVIGSSLGGLTAARTAASDPRVVALVLLAPAFQLAARWRALLGDAFEAWRQTGWREVVDYTTGQPARVDYGFIEDAEVVDPDLPRVTVPTLILHGTRDDSVPIETSRAFVAATSQVSPARLVEVEDGHELTATIPQLLAETEAFLAPWLPPPAAAA